SVQADHNFIETKDLPQSSLDNYSDLGPTPFSHSYLYSVSWGHKVIRFFCKSTISQCSHIAPYSCYYAADVIDYLKTGIYTTVLSRTYWLRTKIHEDKSENVEIQRKKMVSGFLDCDDAEYDGILVALKAGIYIRAIVHSMKMMRSGSTSSRVIMGVVH